MSDIGIFLKSDHRDSTFDVLVDLDDLKLDDGMQTAVIISVFSDREVDTEEIPPEETSRRGWWGDLFADTPGDKIGSRLWLLKREKRVPETLRRAEEYVLEALQWMIEDGVASSIDASAEWDASGSMMLGITVHSPRSTEKFRFRLNWEAEMGGN